MSWKRHFRVIKGQQQVVPNPLDSNRWGGSGSINSNLASYLPLVYAGHPNRIQRYYQFDDMDRDSDINAALDTIADFCTQSEEQSDQPFEVHYNSDPNQSETKIVKTMLDKWVKLNTFRSRLWYIFRDTLKNGDAFYLRDPETQEWLWLDHFMVEMVKVDDTMGKKPDEYLIRGLDFNKQAQYGSKKADPNQYRTPYGTSNIGAARASAVSASSGPAAFSMAGTAVDPRQRHMMGPFAQEVSVIDAQFVVHLSLSIGNDINWPFGPSILEPIFKTFKQKELLEDAIIIYRVQRAPERRIFYIDTGTMPPERAKRHIEAIKNDIHQRRIPNRTGTGGSVLDAAYNPLCISIDTYINLVDGRILSLQQLITEYEDGKKNWVYSCDPVDGTIIEAPITWAGITRREAEVVCVMLDNGGSVIVTPDHKFPTLGGELVKAEQLTSDHKLITRERYREGGRRTGHGDNYMVVHPISVAPLQDKIDVGTITVDKDEIYSPHHNFAISENIFLQNSINDDYFFAQCLCLDTRIGLLDGQTLTLQELIDDHEAGKTNWAYSLNLQTGEVEAGRISWAGVTRRNAEMVRVTLDNGAYADTTPDHRFILRDGSTRQAGELKPMDLLMSYPVDQNRSVVSVAILPYREDTGDITVESPSNSHVFALAAGVYVHNSQDGRGSKVETLPGGEQTGEITDLMFFSRKLARGLRVPVSYLNLGEDEGGNNVSFQDGKLGAAMIQEYRFSKFCMRLQSLLAPIFDKEFKRYMMKNGIEMDWPLFELRFTPPQNFTKYRQIELDAQRMQVYQGVAENRRLAERFKLTRYLGLSEDELLENEKLWAEENAAKLKQKTGASPAESQPGADLGAVGIRSGDEGLPPDLDMPPDDGMEPGGPNMPGGPQAAGPPGGPAGPGGAPPAPGGGAMGGGSTPAM